MIHVLGFQILPQRPNLNLSWRTSVETKTEYPNIQPLINLWRTYTHLYIAALNRGVMSPSTSSGRHRNDVSNTIKRALLKKNSSHIAM